MTKRYAVIGAPIEHSLSPGLHQQFAKNCHIALEYTRILMDEVAFEQQVRDFFVSGGAGLNVTAPAKTRAFELADKTTVRASQAKAANTLWMDEAGTLWADNTDGIGLVSDLKPRIALSGARILIVGAGGAVRGVMQALLAENPCEVLICNRTAARADALVDDIQDVRLKRVSMQALSGTYDVLINATGRAFSGLEAPIGTPFCYDLTYDKSGMTPFVAWARYRGYRALDGFGMLVRQAREAFRVWHGMPE
ncbi:MAG: shikimate dehydrogenase [Legionellaceae bacterium]|nr:shikimate dehydrogenase [Legionellaceae bacterium]